MNYIDFIEGVKRTESDYAKFADWNAEARSMIPGNPASDWRLVHGVLGLVTEVGELFEAEDIQARGGGEPNYLEEVGDLYWYIFIIADTLGISELVDEILSDNDTWNNEDVLPCIKYMSSHAAQMTDKLKRFLIYGKDFEMAKFVCHFNLFLLWLNTFSVCLDLKKEVIMETNNAKLRARYPDKFNSDQAYDRNLEVEQAALKAS